MQIWDTAGQEKFQSVQRIFYRGSDACIIVFDITNPASFTNVSKWKEEFINAANLSSPESFPIILIGNKADLATERKVCPRFKFQVPYSKGLQWCKDNGGIAYFEVSAKTAANVKEGFEDITKKASDKQKGRL